jgi:hypothetical protein
MIAIKIGLKTNVEKDEAECEVDVRKSDYCPEYVTFLHDYIILFVLFEGKLG